MTDDADESQIFTLDEMIAYNPQVCQTCGERSARYDFIETPSYGTKERTFIRGGEHCDNPRCAKHGGPMGKA